MELVLGEWGLALVEVWALAEEEELGAEEEDLVGKGGRGDREKVQKLTKLRKIVARHAVDHPAALRAMLGKAPESARPALLRAIAISEAGYEKALRALD